MATIDLKVKSYDELIFEITRLNTDKYLLEQKVDRLNNIINELEKELIDVTKFKNNILDDLEKRTLEANKLRDKLKLKKGGKMKQELKQFDINLDKIEENSELFDNLHEAIEKMKLYTLSDKFEVVLNKNLIESKEKLTNYRTIMGCRISYDNLDRNISFIVREDTKPTYEELEQKVVRLNNIIETFEAYLDTVLYTYKKYEFSEAKTQLELAKDKLKELKEGKQ